MRLVSTGLLFVSGFLCPDAVAQPLAPPPVASPVGSLDWAPPPADPRVEHIRQFFEKHRCPIAPLAPLFLLASEKHKLDWRLLPSLALIETGGGRAASPNRNVFGWANGRSRFISVEESIDHVAERLANAPSYRDKSLEDKMKAYNPRRRDYASIVKRIMTRLDPPALGPAQIQ
jgi:hypothetical protein